MAKLTQRQLVLQHLEQYGQLDPFTAFVEYGILTNLRTRIVELRRQGYDIETGSIKGKSKVTGRPWKVANYILHKHENQSVQSGS